MKEVNPEKIINAGMMMFYQIATAIILGIILSNCKPRNFQFWATIGGIILFVFSIRIAWNLVTCCRKNYSWSEILRRIFAPIELPKE
jgi:hypothetical protein